MSQVKKFSSVTYVAGPLCHSVNVAYMYIFNWQNVSVFCRLCFLCFFECPTLFMFSPTNIQCVVT